MAINNSVKIKTGIFVTAGITLLLLVIFFIGNQRNLFRNTITLHANYENVAGLQPGNFVRFAGINVGTVDYIDIQNDTTIRVEISIQEKVKQFIKVDSRASIAGDGLMGDKLIQISPGGATSALIAENGELVAVNPFDMEKVMSKIEKAGSKLGNILDNVDTLAGNLSSIFRKVNDGKGTLGRLLNDEKIASDLEKTVASAKKTVSTANKAAEGLSDNMEAAKSNFLLRGFFKKKEKKRIADSTAKAKALKLKAMQNKPPKKN